MEDTEYQKYIKIAVSEMRPYVKGEDLTGIPVGDGVNIEDGGMIARDLNNHSDKWFVGQKYFNENFKLASNIDIEPEHHVDYQGPTNSHNFGEALDLLKEGYKLARKGWNGKDMFIYYVAANKYPMSNNLMETMAGRYKDDMVPYQAYIAFKTVNDTVVPWLASQTDMLAQDWQIVE